MYTVETALAQLPRETRRSGYENAAILFGARHAGGTRRQ